MRTAKNGVDTFPWLHVESDWPPSQGQATSGQPLTPWRLQHTSGTQQAAMKSPREFAEAFKARWQQETRRSRPETVHLEATMAVPSGSTTGEYELVTLLDEDHDEYEALLREAGIAAGAPAEVDSARPAQRRPVARRSWKMTILG